MTQHCFKLTGDNGQSYGFTQWGPGVTHRANGFGDLCGPGWLHFYDDPLVALLLNPLHADFVRPRLWLAKWAGKRREDHGLKVGATCLTTIEELEPPVISPAQRSIFAILCGLEVCEKPAWQEWALSWLSGEERFATAAADMAHYAAHTVHAALAAIHAARGVDPVRVAHDTAAAAIAAAHAADDPLDFPALAAWAMTFGEDV